MGLIYSDIPELEGSNTEISLANLSELEGSLENIIEKRLAHLSELSDAIIEDGGELDIIKSIILSIKSEGSADPDNVIGENMHTANSLFSKISLVERLTLFKEIFNRLSTEKSGVDKFFYSESDEQTVSLDAAERIAYLKNSYNDAAYMQFSALFSSPRAAYFSSVTDVCENVYNGSCEYCILPVETSGDGKLLSFYETILKYGFKINAVYDLHSKNSYTRYALLSRRFAIRNGSLRSKARNRYLEFVFNENDNITLEDLLSAAGFCSLKLRRIDTMNVHTERSTQSDFMCPVFRADGSDLQTFLAFLAIDCPDFIPIGIYVQI
jgi:prephenate dehydratase